VSTRDREPALQMTMASDWSEIRGRNLDLPHFQSLTRGSDDSEMQRRSGAVNVHSAGFSMRTYLEGFLYKGLVNYRS
jgi:hypothetical protein